MVALHVLCCGLPILALAATAAMGASSGLLALSNWAGGVHGFIHGQELVILVLSAALLAVGAAFEWLARSARAGRLPWMLIVSAACFAFNVILVGAHRFA